MLACANATRSVPMGLKVVGGPSAWGNPAAVARMPLAHGAPCSSRVVTSSITSPVVNLLCRVICSVRVTLAPARSTQIGGTSSAKGPAVNTGDSLRELKAETLSAVRLGSWSPHRYGRTYSTLKPRSSCGCRKLDVLTDPYSWRPSPSRLRCSRKTLPPGRMETKSGRPLAPGAIPHSNSTSAVFRGLSFSTMSTATFWGSSSSGFGTTCTLSKSWSRKISRSARLASSTLYSVPTRNGSSRRTTRGLVDPPDSTWFWPSTYTRFTEVISPSMMWASTLPVSIPSKCEMVPNVKPFSW
mmetsp:Transcript_13376/g.25678  ORF Transcript_13376/g.25678 Transcript_13376/m.25678 type:complete len:298 (+) Transcript_13376:696-1589(+)